ncbi:MAG: peptidase E, partial [Cutibacterium avidum]|nr:peptidase E [Cutibacterium avidum]
FVDGEFSVAVAEREEATVSRFSASEEPTSSGILREELDVTVL